MNKFSILLISLILILNEGYSQNLKKVKLSNSIEMESRLNEVWTTISNLENLDKLVPEIVSKTETLVNGKGAIVTLALKKTD